MKEHGPIMGQAANLRGGSFIFYPAIGAPHLPSEQATNRQASGVSSRDLFYDSTSALLLRWLICASDPVIRGAKPHLLHSEHRLVIKKKKLDVDVLPSRLYFSSSIYVTKNVGLPHMIIYSLVVQSGV